MFTNTKYKAKTNKTTVLPRDITNSNATAHKYQKTKPQYLSYFISRSTKGESLFHKLKFWGTYLGDLSRFPNCLRRRNFFCTKKNLKTSRILAHHSKQNNIQSAKSNKDTHIVGALNTHTQILLLFQVEFQIKQKTRLILL